MLDKNLEARTELTSMSYAAEVFLRMLNLYRGSYYKLRQRGAHPFRTKSRFRGRNFGQRWTTCRRAAISQRGR